MKWLQHTILMSVALYEQHIKNLGLAVLGLSTIGCILMLMAAHIWAHFSMPSQNPPPEWVIESAWVIGLYGTIIGSIAYIIACNVAYRKYYDN